MSEYLFCLHYGHLILEVDQIAGRHGARHVNYTEPRGERCGWFACPSSESQFAVASAVMGDIDRAGGIETFRPRQAINLVVMASPTIGG
jgi:hypothetical protein